MKASSYRADCSSIAPSEIRKKAGKYRVYWLVENRSPFPIYQNYDGAAPSNGSQGIEIQGNTKYELWGEFAPNNETIFLTGSNPSAQQVEISEGYREDQQSYASDTNHQ